MNNKQRGREGMRAWEDSKPQNFFTADANLQAVMRRYMGQQAFAAAKNNLTLFGAACATVLDEGAKIEDKIGNHPRLERWTPIGQRVEQIEFHPNHDRSGQIVWQSGIIALMSQPGNLVQQMGLFYLLNHNGENGHSCAVACTASAVRAIQAAASAALKQRFLEALLNPDYEQKLHAAQFLTEVQGGSDVGANAVTAVDQGDGTWRISGEKWFCSNINADLFLMTARVQGGPDGTKGLGMFLVPRLLEDGETNGFYLRRLKDKLGTRTLASAEVDFVEALGYAVGPVENGFKNMVELVLNTSRLMNAVACAGIMRRAYIEASTYACAREAFGTSIANYPLVQETVADVQSETYAGIASSFAVAHLLDQIQLGAASDDDHAVYRILVNINKYITSLRGSETVRRAMEVLGGNGAIESFSILPRLYRDMMVLENWEGTHNTLAIQVLRDISRYRLHEPLLRFINAQLLQANHPLLQQSRRFVETAVSEVERALTRLRSGSQQFAQAHMRRVIDSLAHITQAALLLAEADWELAQGMATDKPDVTAYFINRRLRRDYDPLEDGEYLARLERLMRGA